MATIDITKETIEDTITNNDIVIIDFWAPWCGPCKSFAPTYESVSEKYDDVVFGKVNTEDQQELGANFQIRSIPTLMVFREKVTSCCSRTANFSCVAAVICVITIIQC